MKRPRIVDIALSGDLDFVLQPAKAPDYRLGACEGADTDLFFSDEPAFINEAKAYCGGCPIARVCASWAITYVNYGVQGGLTAKERFLIRGGKEAIELDELRDLQQQYKFIMERPATEVASQHGVEVRTVVRWRNLLRGYELAA
jgi:hypothetical protein